MAKLTDPEAAKAAPPAPTHGAPKPRRDHVAPARMAVPKATGPVKAVPAPLGPVRGPHWMCIHPNRWRVLDGEVVPDPKMLHGTPGANGVDQRKDGSPVMTHAFQAQQDQGWTVLDHECAGPGTSYLQQIDSTGGWIDIWTQTYPGSANTSHNGKAEAAWWLDLIARGVIEPCPLHVLVDMQKTQQRTLDKTIERNRPSHGARIKRLQSVIAALGNEIAKFEEAA